MTLPQGGMLNKLSKESSFIFKEPMTLPQGGMLNKLSSRIFP